MNTMKVFSYKYQIRQYNVDSCHKMNKNKGKNKVKIITVRKKII
jgi:hypothetical protein